MKAFLFYFFLALLFLSVQATIFKVTKPDFVLVLVCFYSLKYGQTRGVTYGALTGLLIDSASGFILGPNILSKFLTGFMIISIRQKLFQWNIIISTLLIAIFSLADIFLVYICLKTFAGISFVNRPLRISIMQIVYTTAVGFILYPLLNPEKNDKNGK
jgi:rod shape-determining protein MreD